MQKVLLLFAFFFSFTVVFSQNYTPMPTSNAVWVDSALWQSRAGNLTLDHCETIQTEIIGDTLINGIIYHTLFQRKERFDANFIAQPCYLGTRTYQEYTYAFYRNDSAQKKVFIRMFGDTIDQLLYDFNLNVGDSLPNTFLYTNNNQINSEIDTVIAVTQINLGLKLRIIYTLSDTICMQNTLPPLPPIFPNYIKGSLIEGIGHTHGFLYPHDCDPSGIAKKTLLSCFHQNGRAVYPDSTHQCQLIVGTINNTFKDLKWQLYPNPSSGEFFIDSSTKLKSIQLFDIKGRFIKEYSPIKSSWQLPEEKGIYFLRLEDHQGQFQFKKIVRQ